MADVNTVLAALLGLGAGTGLLLIGIGLRPRRTQSWRPRPVYRAVGQHGVLRVALATAAGMLTAVATQWLVGAVLAGLAAWSLPRLLGRNRDHEEGIAKIEAIAGWTEMLRDTLAAAAGIEQAIVATAPIAPAPIRSEITTLAVRVESGHRLTHALRQLAHDLDDPSGDLVVAALSQAAQRQASRLGDLLSTLAQAAREQAGMRLRVEANRARTRTSIRVIVGTTIAFATGLVIFNRDYLTAYDDTIGQLVLLVVGGLFAAGFSWLSRIGRIDEPARLFDPDTRAVDHHAAPTPAGLGQP